MSKFGARTEKVSSWNCTVFLPSSATVTKSFLSARALKKSLLEVVPCFCQRMLPRQSKFLARALRNSLVGFIPRFWFHAFEKCDPNYSVLQIYVTEKMQAENYRTLSSRQRAEQKNPPMKSGVNVTKIFGVRVAREGSSRASAPKKKNPGKAEDECRLKI